MAEHVFISRNRGRRCLAAERDVPIARTLLKLQGWDSRQQAVAYARAREPEWSWSQIGAALDLTKDQAVAVFRRMAVAAGLR